MVMTFLIAIQRQFVVRKNDPASIAEAIATIKLLVNEHKGIKDIHPIANAVESELNGITFLKLPLKFLGTVVEDDALKKLPMHINCYSNTPLGPGATLIWQLALTLKSLPLRPQWI